MPRQKEIEVYLIASTAKTEEFISWLKSLGVSAESIARITNGTDGEAVVAAAAKQCYMSFDVGMNPNVTKVRTDMVEYIDNILASGHGSVLEHVYFTFAINNLTRVATAELNRHRAGAAISERSMRYIRFEDSVAFWMPLCFRDQPEDDNDLMVRKRKSQEVFRRSFDRQQKEYAELCNIWTMDESHHNFHYKKTMTSAFRRIIGMGVCTGGVWTFNIRALRHILTMRCSKAAEEEINLIASVILNKMREAEPLLFDDFDDNNVPKYPKV